MEKSVNKIVNMRQAINLISDGDNITISGFGPYLMPLALIREIIRQKKKDLELTSVGEAWAADILVGANCINKIRMSNYMFEGFGRCYNFSRAVENGDIIVEDYSHFGITSRLFAGAIGLPFIPTKVMMGTDIINKSLSGKKYEKYISKFGKKEQVLLLPSIKPDVALIHAARADKKGNIQLFGSKAALDEQARASKTVIVSVEEIVDTELIEKESQYTIIPNFLVDAVVELPYGAYPGGISGYYDFDESFMKYYWKKTRTNNFDKYLNKYVHGIESHWEYLDLIGIRRLLELRIDPYYRYSKNRGGEFCE